ncbi:MAG: hypothetical protein IJH91_03125 [Mogibacterium sp.]|nr:hypothetical protein [Mogibacterium sp.]
MKQLYKKILSVLMILVMTTALAACGSSSGGSTGPTQEQIDEALRLYACQVLSTVRNNPSADSVSAVEQDDNVALCDLNNDGLPDLAIFEYDRNGYGRKTLHFYTVKDGKLVRSNYDFVTPGTVDDGAFLYSCVSWGPKYAFFIDAEGRPCLEAAQGGATSGEYWMTAYQFGDELQETEGRKDWQVRVSDDVSSDVKFSKWNIEGAGIFIDREVVEENFQAVVDDYDAELQGAQKVIFYSYMDSTHFSEELLAEADDNSMSYDEFLDYVTEQTGTSYDELVDMSYEDFME